MRRPLLARAGVRLVALLLIAVCLANVAITPTPAALAAVCAGDEQILLAPAAPHVGGSMMVAAMSAFPHEDVLLLGPNGPIPVVRAAIGERFVWQELVLVDRPGVHLFVFAVAGGASPVTTCADASVLIPEPPLVASLNPFGSGGASVAGPDQSAGVAGQSSGDAGPADDAVDAEDSGDVDDPSGAPRPARRPTRTATPRPDNENENESSNDNEPTPTRTPTSTRIPTSTRVPTATNTPRPTATDTPEPTPTLGPASISSLSPSRPVCGQPLTINGERFGNSRSAVDGNVRIDGREAGVDGWSMGRIQVSVPNGVRGGNSRLLEVIVAGRNTAREIAITC